VVSIRAGTEVIQGFEFDDAWYPPTDGGGYSLVPRSTAGEPDWGVAGSWRRSTFLQGSPGAVDPEPAVTGRRIFYNNSAWDDPALGFGNASAIATDKSAYLPATNEDGPPAGVANVTSYARGINGIMVELVGPHGALSAADFAVKMSGQLGAANNLPDTWTATPSFTVTVIANTPTAGTDRVELVWPDGAIVNRYVQVIVRGNDALGGNNTNTALAASDVFYFGNKVGDTFTGFSGSFETGAMSDQVQVRFNQGLALDITNPYDFDKDFFVDASDEIAARFSTGVLPAIDLSGPVMAAAQAGDGRETLALALALAARPPAADALLRVEPANYDVIDPARTALSVEPPEVPQVSEPATVAAADGPVLDLALDDELLDALLDERT
jgi:hypothetical protein